MLEQEADTQEDGENYFISMTDMMVGVLFIFIIMLMVFALDFKKKTDVNEDALAIAQEVAKHLDTLRKEVHAQIAVLDAAQQTRRQLLLDIQAQLKAEGMDVAIDEANGVLHLTENAVRFATDHSDLDDKARANVDKIAKVLQVVLPKYAACKSNDGAFSCAGEGGSTVETIFIEGHTDITGSEDVNQREKRNWQLSTERAVNTYREIVSTAADVRSLRNLKHEEIMSVSGYSSTRPVDAGGDEQAYAKNRRIDLRFVMEVDSKQKLEDILKLTDDMKEQIDRLSAISASAK